MGIAAYVSAFQAIDQSVKSGATEGEITDKVASLKTTLDEQFKRGDVMKTEQLGPPVAGSRWTGWSSHSSPRRRRNWPGG